MPLVVIVPGVLGSELWQGVNRIWPPGLDEHKRDARTYDQLITPGLEPRNIVRRVSAFNWKLYEKVYEGLAERLSEILPTEEVRLEVHYYDWRRGVKFGAESLARRLNEIGWGDEIALIAHSMGGLVVRQMLEERTLVEPPRVCKAIFIATPHYGSPLAIKHAVGHENPVGFADEAGARLGAHSGFLAMYDLLPSQRLLGSGFPDYATPQTAAFVERFKLSANNLRKRRRHTRPIAKRPAGTRYYNLVCTDQTTIMSVTLDPSSKTGLSEESNDEGDGTVPFASQVADFNVNDRRECASIPATHDGVLRSEPAWEMLKPTLKYWLDRPFCTKTASVGGKGPPPPGPPDPEIAPDPTGPAQRDDGPPPGPPNTVVASTPLNPLYNDDHPPSARANVYRMNPTEPVGDADIDWRVEEASVVGDNVQWTLVDEGVETAVERALLRPGGYEYAIGVIKNAGVYRVSSKVTRKLTGEVRENHDIVLVAASAVLPDAGPASSPPDGGTGWNWQDQRLIRQNEEQAGTTTVG